MQNLISKAVQHSLGGQFLEYFFSEADAKFFASLGLNCIRIPFNYKHFEGASIVITVFWDTDFAQMT